MRPGLARPPRHHWGGRGLQERARTPAHLIQAGEERHRRQRHPAWGDAGSELRGRVLAALQQGGSLQNSGRHGNKAAGEPIAWGEHLGAQTPPEKGKRELFPAASQERRVCEDRGWSGWASRREGRQSCSHAGWWTHLQRAPLGDPKLSPGLLPSTLQLECRLLLASTSRARH